MRYSTLGKSGLKVSQLIFGGHHIGDVLDEAATRRLIDACWDSGINAFYTADYYNAGIAQEIIGRALKDRRHDAVIINKIGRGAGTEGTHRALLEGRVDDFTVWREHGVAPTSRGSSRKSLIRAMDESLRRLQTDYVDVCSMHFWDDDTPLEETLDCLAEFVRAGKARYIGCSNFSAWQLYRALWVSDVRGLPPMRAYQTEYNVFNRIPEMEQLPACDAGGVGALIHNSLAGNLLTNRDDLDELTSIAGRTRIHHLDEYVHDDALDRAKRMRTLARETQREPGELAQGWVLSRAGVCALLIGPNDPAELPPMLKAVDNPLTRDELSAVEAIAVAPPVPIDKTLASAAHRTRGVQ